MSTKNYYQYISDTKDTTCEACIKNNGKIFFEDTVPTLPVHPNCLCTLKELTYYDGELPDLSNINYGQWCASDEKVFWDKLPYEYSYPWLRIMLSNEQYIFYNLDGEILITNDGLKTIQVVDASDELIEFLTSLKATILFREESVYIKNIQMIDPLAKPVLTINDYNYYRMDNGTVLRAYMPYLQRRGILPNGTVVIGNDTDESTRDYYYNLLLLKSQLTLLKTERNNDNISRIEFENEYETIRNQVIKLMTIRYPELKSHEISIIYEDNWRDIPDDYYIINDVTKEINDIINGYLTDPDWAKTKESNVVNIVSSFYNEVKKDAPVDLKNQSEWYHPLYIYDNEIVDVDVLGNIIYGALGAYLNFSVEGLYFGASVAQTLDNLNWRDLKIQSDDPRDVMWWLKGYYMYFDKWYVYEGDN